MENKAVSSFLELAINIASKMGMGIEKAIDLAVQEAPGLYSEVLWYIRIELLFVLIPAWICVLTIFLLNRKVSKRIENEANSEWGVSKSTKLIICNVIAWIAILFAGGFAMNATKEFVQFVAAPRVYLAKMAFDIYKTRPTDSK